MSVTENVYVCGSLYERMCMCVYGHVHKHYDLARGAGRVGIRIGKGPPGSRGQRQAEEHCLHEEVPFRLESSLPVGRGLTYVTYPNIEMYGSERPPTHGSIEHRDFAQEPKAQSLPTTNIHPLAGQWRQGSPYGPVHIVFSWGQDSTCDI